jgi:hypothetical protein
MLISQLIAELTVIAEQYGDIPVQLQSTPEDDIILNDDVAFAVAEEYDDGWYVNLRSWPY